ncbi:MAG: MerR family transcriptional regulator [Aeromicrobium erythreum]
MRDHELWAVCETVGPDSGLSWSIGECAKAFALAPATLRAWEARYGMAPSGRSTGGHRRYTCDDIQRLRLMTTLMDRGVHAREAAALALDLDADEIAVQLATADAAGMTQGEPV